MAVFSGPKVVTDGLVFSYDMNNSVKSWKGRPTVNLTRDSNNNTYHPNNRPYSGMAHGSVAVSTDIEPPHPGLTVYKVSDDGVDPQNVRYSVRFNMDDSWMSYDTNYVWSVYIWLPEQFKDRWTTFSRAIYQNSTGTDWHGTRGYNATYNYYGAGIIHSTYGDPDPTITGQWQRMYVTFNPLSANIQLAENNGLDNNKWVAGYLRANITNAVNNTGFPYHLYLAGGQLEEGTVPSPFVADSRTTTTAIADLTGNNTLTANSLTYNTDGTFEWGTTADYATFTDPGYPTTWADNFSFEAWHYVPTGTDWHDQVTFGSNSGSCIIGRGSYAGSHGLARRDTDTISHCVRTDSGLYFANYSASYDTWYHIVGTYDGSNNRLYINGNLEDTTAVTVTGVPDSGGVRVGGNFAFGGNNGATAQGLIPEAKMYSRALSAEEIKQNFENTRGKYGV